MDLKVILFDLDGTLLPMDQDVFVKTYFGLLAKNLRNFSLKKLDVIFIKILVYFQN